MKRKKISTIENIKEEIGPTTAALLTKQFQIIGADVRKINFIKKDWFMDSSWTEGQEQEFKKWFINYLYGNLKRTQEITKFARIIYRYKERLAKVWYWWDLDYGWRKK